MTAEDAQAIRAAYDLEKARVDRRWWDPYFSAEKYDDPGEWWAHNVVRLRRGQATSPGFAPSAPWFKRAWGSFARPVEATMDEVGRRLLRLGKKDEAKRVFGEIEAFNRDFQPYDDLENPPPGLSLSRDVERRAREAQEARRRRGG